MKNSFLVFKKQGCVVPPADQIDIITGALAGSANKTLLSWATRFGLNGVGLCLGDGQLAKVTKISDELKKNDQDYKRQLISTPYGSAWIYLYQKPVDGLREIKSGDWLKRHEEE